MRIESTCIAYAKYYKPRGYSWIVLPDEIHPLTVEYMQNLKVGIKYRNYKQVLRKSKRTAIKEEKI